MKRSKRPLIHFVSRRVFRCDPTAWPRLSTGILKALSANADKPSRQPLMVPPNWRLKRLKFRQYTVWQWILIDVQAHADQRVVAHGSHEVNHALFTNLR